MSLTLLLAAVLLSSGDDLAEKLRKLDPKVGAEGKTIRDDARDRIRAVNLRESRAWRKIRTREEWEAYRDKRIVALDRSLGSFPQVPQTLNVRVTRTIEGEGFKIENLVFESRFDLHVTANLYVPAERRESMPGILICHSHHRPKTQGELQDMGMTWARLGCVVLVMDQLGHGERRAHPFVDASSYPKKYRTSRQDYHFRYFTGMQLHTIGDSLIGWMVWDMMRGVDLLLSRPGVDPERIIVLGAVAGGGDPAAVLAAVDPRVKAVAPFNFGGPQPENVFPLPENAEDAFNYAGSGGWESTRNLRLSVRDGFLPWVIVGSIAPRRLVYAHEFAWDRDNDPVWKRFNRLYKLYGEPERLTWAKGRGSVRGRPPEATHCTNIGAVHRKQFHPAFKKWFGIPVPNPEYSNRKPSEALMCLTPEIKLTPVHGVAVRVAAERLKKARQRLAELSRVGRVNRLRKDWARLMGGVEPAGAVPKTMGDGDGVERRVLKAEDAIEVPLLYLVPQGERKGVVIGVAREGKEAFLKNRSEEISTLLRGGVAVCLPDLRGTGETKIGSSRGRRSTASGISSTELMLGRTLLGLRLRDLRMVISFVRTKEEVPIAIWGDSFARVNPKDRNVRVPLEVDEPHVSSPMGGVLALFAALYEDDVKAVYARGGLVGFESLLEDQFCWLPHDIIVPGALTAGDLNDVAAALAPRSVRLDAQVNALNRRVTEDRGVAEGVRWLMAQLKE